MNKDSKIYVAGHRGLVGGAIMRRLTAAGYTNIITRTHVELDLTNQASVTPFLKMKNQNTFSCPPQKSAGLARILHIRRISFMKT